MAEWVRVVGTGADLEDWRAKIRAKSRRTAKGCRVWTGAPNGTGYGSFSYRGDDGRTRWTGAHRASYIAFRGPIPDGMTIDHLCRNKLCVNPDHMEVVTAAENIRRAVPYRAPAKPRMLAPDYPCGHPRSDENTTAHTLAAGRVVKACRTCIRERKRMARIRAWDRAHPVGG